MKRYGLRFVLVLICSLAFMGLALLSDAPHVAAIVPTRPTPTPSPQSTPVPGGNIELWLPAARGQVWTAIQWQGVGGAWHDTDGWRGAPDEMGVVRWYVGPEHLGQGPFRWLVYDREGGRLLGVSDPFFLPDRPRTTLTVALTLSQP